jgi:hypothetical protein
MLLQKFTMITVFDFDGRSREGCSGDMYCNLFFARVALLSLPDSSRSGQLAELGAEVRLLEARQS